jgi:hypothetical protein
VDSFTFDAEECDEKEMILAVSPGSPGVISPVA